MKAKNLGKIHYNLSNYRDNANKAYGQLDAPMSKLRKGKRKAPSKNVRIDIDNIEQGIETGIALNGYRIASSLRSREDLGRYNNSSEIHNVFNMQNMMVMWMITEGGDIAIINIEFNDQSIKLNFGIVVKGLSN